MSLDYYIEHKGDTLYAVASGEVKSFKEICNYRYQIIKNAYKRKCLLVMCNEMSLYYHLTYVEMIRMGEKLKEIAPPGLKVVFICNQEILKITRFFEAICFNLGLEIKFKSDKEEGAEWLLKEKLKNWL